jgi:membrane-associated phospholipid phosphatase
LVRGHAEVRQAAALRHGEQLLHVERWLHIDLEHSVNLWAAQQSALSLLASYWYQFAHLSATLAVLVWCWLRRVQSYRRVRNALVLTNVFGLAIFLLYPAAPPRFLPGFGFVDAVARAGFGTSHGGPVTADQYGAFPSLHLAWAVWTAVVAHRLVRSSVLRWLWLSYPLVTATVVIATGNHYLLDVLAGVLIALVTLAIAHRIPRRRGSGVGDRHDLGGPGAGLLKALAQKTQLSRHLSENANQLADIRSRVAAAMLARVRGRLPDWRPKPGALPTRDCQPLRDGPPLRDERPAGRQPATDRQLATDRLAPSDRRPVSGRRRPDGARLLSSGWPRPD